MTSIEVRFVNLKSKLLVDLRKLPKIYMTSQKESSLKRNPIILHFHWNVFLILAPQKVDDIMKNGRFLQSSY